MSEIKHIEAFEFYYALGSDRTYEQVAQKFRKSIKTVEIWGSKEGWQEEVRNRDLEAYKLSREKAIKSKAEKISDYTKINRAIVGNLVNKVKKDALDDKGIKSYLEVAKFDLVLPDLEESIYAKLLGNEDIADGVGTQPEGVNNDKNADDDEEITFKFV